MKLNKEDRGGTPLLLCLDQVVRKSGEVFGENGTGKVLGVEGEFGLADEFAAIVGGDPATLGVKGLNKILLK